MSRAKSEPLPVPDFQDMILAHLRKTSPKKEENAYEIHKTDEMVLSKIQYVLTTGIPPFDDIIGGMPFGRIVEVYGIESCGKTAMAIRCASRARRGFISEVTRDAEGTAILTPLNPEDISVAVLYIDNERSLDDDKKLVVDGHKLDVMGSYCDTVDMLFKQIDDAIQGMEAAAAEMRKQHKTLFLVIIVDTIASTSNAQEQKQEWGKVDFSRAPAQYSQGFRKMVRKVNANNVCLICTNQVRINYQATQQAAKMGRKLTGNSSFEYNSYGGAALRFYASHRVFMHATQSKYKLMPTAQFSAGINVSFHSVKNRLRMPMRDGRMVLLFDKEQGGLNPVFSYLESFVLLRGIEITVKEKGTDFICHFAKWGIEPTTFDPEETSTSLEEDDNSIRVSKKRSKAAKKSPGFKYRADWPTFFEAHKADLDLLWAAVVNGAFTTDGLDGQGVIDIDEDDPAAQALPDLED